MSNVDLDALRQARREAYGDGPTVTFGGHTFQLPIELPFAVPEALIDVAIATDAGDSVGITKATTRTIKALLGENFDEFMALGPSMDDVKELLNAVLAQYGMGDVGEPQASE